MNFKHVENRQVSEVLGRQVAEVSISWNVRKDTWDWILEKTEWSEEKAKKWILEQLRHYGSGVEYLCIYSIGTKLVMGGGDWMKKKKEAVKCPTPLVEI